MRFLEAYDLLPKTLDIRTVQIGAGGSEIGTVVNCVDSAKGVLLRKNVIEPRRAKVISNGLQRIVQRFRNSAKVRSTRARNRPERDERRNTDKNQSGRRADCRDRKS